MVDLHGTPYYVWFIFIIIIIIIMFKTISIYNFTKFNGH